MRSIYTYSIEFFMANQARRDIAKGSPTRLRAIRKQLGWTQARFAEALGVRPNTIARWERGDLVPPLVAELAAEYIVLKQQKGEAS